MSSLPIPVTDELTKTGGSSSQYSVSLGEDDGERDPAFSEFYQEVHVNLPDFVSGVYEDEEHGQVR